MNRWIDEPLDAGWYDLGNGFERYWTGHEWTHRTRLAGRSPWRGYALVAFFALGFGAALVGGWWL